MFSVRMKEDCWPDRNLYGLFSQFQINYFSKIVLVTICGDDCKSEFCFLSPFVTLRGMLLQILTQL